MTPTISLGRTYKDTLTPFQGVAISRTEHIHMTPLVGLQAPEVKDGEPMKTVYLEETRLVAVD